MVGLNTGKSLKRKPKAEKAEDIGDAMLSMASISAPSGSGDSDVEDLPMSVADLGINLDALNLSLEDRSEEDEPEEPEAPPSKEAPDLLDPSEEGTPSTPPAPEPGMQLTGLLKEAEETIPLLPFLFIERNGREVVLFSRSRFLPTVRLRLKPGALPERASVFDDTSPAIESGPPSLGAPIVELAPEPPAKVVDFTMDQELETLMEELGLPKSSLDLNGLSLEEEPSAYGIPPGAVILLEGGDGVSLAKIADRVAGAFLSRNKTLTYVSTRRDIKEVVGSVVESPAEVSAAMKDMRLLVIPVYPIVRGQSADRQALMEKLTGSPHLFDKNVILLNSFTDLLEDRTDDLEAIKAWPFLRKLSAKDKVVILTASSQHRAVASMREACSVHLKIAAGGNAPSVEVVKAPEDRPDRLHLLRFRVDAKGALAIL